MAGWQNALLMGAVFFCAVGIYNLTQMVAKLQGQLSHTQMLLYKEMRKMQGDQYEND